MLQQFLLSFFITGCTTSPHGDSSADAKISLEINQDETLIPPREIFLRRFFNSIYATAVDRGHIYEDKFIVNNYQSDINYRLNYKYLRFFATPNRLDSFVLDMSDVEAQQFYDVNLMRNFFKQDVAFIQSLEDVYTWVRWLESFVYQADILLKQEDALHFFQDRDRLISSVNPFFYAEFDGDTYNLNYFTMQNNTLWQKHISLTQWGEIIHWQQGSLSLERKGGF